MSDFGLRLLAIDHKKYGSRAFLPRAPFPRFTKSTIRRSIMTEGDSAHSTPPEDDSNILHFRPPAINLRRQISRPARRAEPLSPQKALAEREKLSLIIKAAVTYCGSYAAYAAGFAADHTADWVFCGAGDIIGGKHVNSYMGALRRLTRLIQQDGNLLTVELWSVASVARLLFEHNTQPDGYVDLQAKEMKFLRAFARLVERLCKEQYDRELAAIYSNSGPAGGAA
jgi:hypothetical protein